MTTLVKALGGPRKAATVGLVVVGASGYGVIRLAEAGGKKIAIASKRALADRRARSKLIGRSFIIETAGTDDQGVEFTPGSRYTVLEHDEDAILVELVGDGDNPHVVSSEFLSSISDFPDSSIPTGD